jgi:hypothetical protein
MFPSINKKPINVTMFGASHMGNNSTTAFHYSKNIAISFCYFIYDRGKEVRDGEVAVHNV